jgi:ActR/RegA family two-component response regulator
MSYLFLIQFEERYSNNLAKELARCSHVVTEVHTILEFERLLSIRKIDPDFVLIDLSSDGPEIWRNVDRIQRTFADKQIYPTIIGYSRIYRGAEMRLRAAKRGIRFVYED